MRTMKALTAVSMTSSRNVNAGPTVESVKYVNWMSTEVYAGMDLD